MGRYLVDKSALARLHLRPAHQRLEPLIESGDIASCSIVDLALLYSARNLTEYEALRDERRGLPRVTVSQSTFDDSITIQHELARNGHHRLPIPDLIIAAAARSADSAVIHYDNDFQLIADQRTSSTSGWPRQGTSRPRLFPTRLPTLSTPWHAALRALEKTPQIRAEKHETSP